MRGIGAVPYLDADAGPIRRYVGAVTGELAPAARSVRCGDISPGVGPVIEDDRIDAARPSDCQPLHPSLDNFFDTGLLIGYAVVPSVLHRRRHRQEARLDAVGINLRERRQDP